jgi:hypothetical protein
MGEIKDLMTRLLPYEEASEYLSSYSGRRIKLIGHAKSIRQCFKCRRSIAENDFIIKYGQIDGYWKWICSGCAPAPYELPCVRELMEELVEEEATSGDLSKSCIRCGESTFCNRCLEECGDDFPCKGCLANPAEADFSDLCSWCDHMSHKDD